MQRYSPVVERRLRVAASLIVQDLRESDFIGTEDGWDFYVYRFDPAHPPSHPVARLLLKRMGGAATLAVRLSEPDQELEIGTFLSGVHTIEEARLYLPKKGQQ